MLTEIERHGLELEVYGMRSISVLCTCVSELICLDVTVPSQKNISSDNRSAHSLISRGDDARPGPARAETRMSVDRWGALELATFEAAPNFLHRVAD